jgi:phosphoketolase
MARFMAVFTGSPGAGAGIDEATQQRGIAAWGEWMARHAGQVAEGGGPLGKTKRISKTGVQDARNNLAAYVVVEADSHEAAARMFENHPHFTIFPGDGVEVMPILPIPGA